ncbi:MAG: hypothetical protein K6U80_19695 [Firmicutes bacterium]|nr:hypothetical protein [Bacillota bacterium]
MGVMTLPANLIAGFLWDKVSPASLFYFGAACALAALVLLSLAGIEKKQELKAG